MGALDPPERQPRIPRWLDEAAALSWRLLLVTAGVIVVVYGLAQVRLIVLPVIVALFATALLNRPTRFLRRRGAPAGIAAFVVLFGSLAAVVALVVAVAPSVTPEFGQVDDRVREGITEVTDSLSAGPLELDRKDIDRAVDRAQDQLGADSGAITRRVLSGAVFVGEVVAGALLALVLTFFFLKDGGYMWRWLTALFSEPVRHDLREIGDRGWTTLSAYLGGIAVVALVDTALISLVLILVGVPFVVPLACLTYIGAFIPVVGATVAGLVSALVALVSLGPLEAGVVVVATFVIQQIDGDVVHPLVVGRAVKLHPVTILLSVTGGAILAGVAGAFIAVPLAAVASSTAAYLREKPAAAPT
ncbi:MAG: AI-2E family transporter [Actinomycetota bacterium]|nr:AI-2E family transporter [Actinomycetota bacterium]